MEIYKKKLLNQIKHYIRKEYQVIGTMYGTIAGNREGEASWYIASKAKKDTISHKNAWKSG